MHKILTSKRLYIWLSSLILLSALLVVFAGSGVGNMKLKTNIDLENKVIIENGDDGIFPLRLSWLRDVLGEGLMAFTGSWAYQNLALSNTRYVYVREGLRREEVVGLFSKQLDWDTVERADFISAPEGMYYPGSYLLSKDKDSEIVRELMLKRFEREIADRYATSTKKIISIPTALKIASLVEREANGKSDMRLISGIIWNRIFKDMPLQIDATLQYVRGTEEDGWWPIVVSADKKLASPYNTYKFKGFPPTPIANPGLASIDAALRPKKTNCLFYLHDSRRRIHCSQTY